MKLNHLIPVKCIFVFLISMLCSHAVCAQTGSLSLTIENKTIQEVLSLIEQKSDFKFTYNLSQIDAGRKVSLKAENLPVTEILDKLFAGQNVKYTIKGKSIVLYKDLKDSKLPPPHVNKTSVSQGLFSMKTAKPFPAPMSL
jgi:hypothetical protein